MDPIICYLNREEANRLKELGLATINLTSDPITGATQLQCKVEGLAHWITITNSRLRKLEEK